MRLTEEQIRRLAERLFDGMTENRQAILKTSRSEVEEAVREVIRANLAAEQDLELEARKLVEIHCRQAPPDLDRQKLLQMIKKRLAEEKEFPL